MGFLENLSREVQRLHLNYNMITSLYMMEPMERTVVNCFVILALSLMLYSSWVYLPHYTIKLLYFSGLLPSLGHLTEIHENDHVQSVNSEL